MYSWGKGGGEGLGERFGWAAITIWPRFLVKTAYNNEDHEFASHRHQDLVTGTYLGASPLRPAFSNSAWVDISVPVDHEVGVGTTLLDEGRFTLESWTVFWLRGGKYCHQGCISLQNISASVNILIEKQHTCSPSCKQLGIIIVLARKEITGRIIYVKASKERV